MAAQRRGHEDRQRDDAQDDVGHGRRAGPAVRRHASTRRTRAGAADDGTGDPSAAPLPVTRRAWARPVTTCRTRLPGAGR